MPEPDEANTNDNANVRNGSAVYASFMPAPELARLLGTNAPRLKRYLLKPEFAGYVRELPRTGPGRQTVTSVNVRAIPKLRAALASEKARDEHKQVNVLSLPTDVSELTRAYLAMLTERADKQVEEQAATIRDLRTQRDELKAELKQERERVSLLTSGSPDTNASTAQDKVPARKWFTAWLSRFFGA